MKAGRTNEKSAKSRPKTDRRILRTRDTLGNALFALTAGEEFR